MGGASGLFTHGASPPRGFIRKGTDMSKAQIEVTYKGDAAQLMQVIKKVHEEEKKVAAGADKITDATKKTAAEQRKWGREAKKILNEIRSPQESHNKRVGALSQMLQKGTIDQKQFNAAVRQSSDNMRQADRAGTKAFGPAALSAVRSLAAAMGFTGGVAGAIALVNQGYETWKKNVREIAEESNKASNDIIAFAALQEGGKKAERVEAAGTLAARYGIADRGEAFQTVQALQSIHGGDFGKGMKAAETVFAGTQVGIPLDRGRELEILGASQGQAPGDAIRRAYVAGQESGRDPAALAGAASGLNFFDDKEFGFAVAGVLSGSLPEDQLPTYLKRAGQSLSKVGPLQDMFEKMGMGDATRFERLRKLNKLGLDTEEELKGAGVTELRQIQALTSLVPNFSEVARILPIIRAKAKPGLFAGDRKAIEAELPQTADARVSERFGSEFDKETGFGRSAAGARAATEVLDARGLAMKRLGYEQAGPFDLIEEKQSTFGDLVQGEAMGALGLGKFNSVAVERERIGLQKAAREGRTFEDVKPREERSMLVSLLRDALLMALPGPVETAARATAAIVPAEIRLAESLFIQAAEKNEAAAEANRETATQLQSVAAGGATLGSPDRDR